MNMTRVTGLEQVLRNLAASKDVIGERVARGLSKAGVFLQHESQKVVPVQTGNLKGSAFTRRFGQGVHADVVVGYTANYAAFVHEDLTKAHGRAFNTKHADEIANAGRWSSNIDTAKTTFKPRLKAGTAAGGMFPRGEEQQAKFLESPAKIHRGTLLRIIAESI